MGQIKFKASELRGPQKFFRSEGDSRNSNEAKRVTMGITHNGKEYGLMYMTRQVGYTLRMFDAIVKMGEQDEHETFDITPDDTLCTVYWKDIDKALASFGTRIVTMTLTEKQITLEDESGSKVVVQSAEGRQLELPLESQSVQLASKLASQIDSEQMASDALQVGITDLCNGLLPAMKVTTMAGNASDKKGVHLHSKDDTLRIVGAHTEAMFVYEAEEAVAAKDEGTELDCIISPDAAKRLRELLVREIANSADAQGVCNLKVLLKQCGEVALEVCVGNWLMTISLLDICATDCTAYLDMPGKNLRECERTALLQKANGMMAMGELEAFWHLEDSRIVIEGEQQQHKGERVLAVDCKAYGAGEQVPVRKHALKPVITMLSAASAAENCKTVKVMADADDEVLAFECDGYNLFVG